MDDKESKKNRKFNWKGVILATFIFGLLPLISIVIVNEVKISKSTTDYESKVEIITKDITVNAYGGIILETKDANYKSVYIQVGDEENGVCVDLSNLIIGNLIKVKGRVLDYGAYDVCSKKDILRKIIQGDYYFEVLNEKSTFKFLF